jgi:hypothetical protein
MKKLMGFLLVMIGISGLAFAQNGLTNVIIHRGGSGTTVDAHVVLAGPGANAVTSVSVLFNDDSQSRVGTTLVGMSGGNGGSWSGTGSTNLGLDQADLSNGVITIRHDNGDVTNWGFSFRLGSGTRTSAGQASCKAELL